MLRMNVIGILLAASMSFSDQNDLTVVVNPNSNIETLSKADLKRIFTGRISKIQDEFVNPAMLSEHSPYFEKTTQNATGMKKSEFKKFWLNAQIRGKGTAPVQELNAKQLKEYVSYKPGAIALIKKSELDGSVKEVTIID